MISEPAAHLDQLVRQTRVHHVQLSMMADFKANMLLTMAALVMTVSVPQILQGRFVAPLVALVLFCLTTVVLAAYATMPKLPMSLRPRPAAGVRDPTFNVLFFGDFARMSYEEFETEMEQVMNDPARAYGVQVHEVYTLGVFLARKKYRYLRLAYLAFITGLLLSAVLLALTLGPLA